MPSQISIISNEPTVIHVSKLPEIDGSFFNFGYSPGKLGTSPTLRVQVKLVTIDKIQKQTELATYKSLYKIEPEDKVTSDDLYQCCLQAVHGMKVFLQHDSIGRTIPPQYMLSPEKSGFGPDLEDLAKVLNNLPDHLS